jgi:hypothetical protein
MGVMRTTLQALVKVVLKRIPDASTHSTTRMCVYLSYTVLIVESGMYL